jgi:DNA polymerase-4
MRKIIHVDMDCFYAAIEMREDPNLVSVPLAIGGAQDRRGVLCTCNYVARRYGVRAAMPTFIAKQKCPELIILPPRFELYRKESTAIREIFLRYTKLIEPLSLDEAFLDVSEAQKYQGSATLIAKAICYDIYNELGLTASAGVANNKLIAKIASDENKPNGICVVLPSEVMDFMYRLPVKKIFGVGPKLLEKLAIKGIETCGDLQEETLQALRSGFGKMGGSLYQYCRGKDDRPVNQARKRKSISVEWTFTKDIQSNNAIQDAAKHLLKRLMYRWELAGQPKFHKLFVKIKTSDFKSHTKEQVTHQISLDTELFILMLQTLYQQNPGAIRLIGLGMRLDQNLIMGQLDLPFPEFQDMAIR